MIKTTITRLCDACGEQITGYSGRVPVLKEEEEGLYTDNYDFCKDCMQSFTKWLITRRKTNNG